jgi:hypothetical protein
MIIAIAPLPRYIRAAFGHSAEPLLLRLHALAAFGHPAQHVGHLLGDGAN